MEVSKKNDSLTIVVGHAKSGVSADGFVKIFQKTLKLLKAMDREIDAGATKRKWNVTKVSMNSPLHLSISAPYRVAPVKTTDAFVRDISRLERGEDPVYLNAAMRSDAKALTKVLREDVQWFEYQSEEEAIRPTEKISDLVDVLMPMSGSYREVGSVEGRLEIASVHGSDHIKVWDRRFDVPVDCMVTKRQFDEALVYLKNRSSVSVRGMIHFSNRRPARVANVVDIREMPGVNDRVAINSIRPIDLTGGIEPADYLRGDDDEN